MNQKTETIIIGVFILIAIFSTSLIVYLTLRPQSTPQAQTDTPTDAPKRIIMNSDSTDPNANSGVTSASTSGVSGDINDDGMVTTADVQMVTAQLGCTSTDACWNEVIGKTLSGDNPLYASDLDMNKDLAVNEADEMFVRDLAQ